MRNINTKKYIRGFILLIICLHLFPAINAVSERTERKTLSVMNGWNLWHDRSATWENDKLYLPEEVNINALALNAPGPTGGWKTLDKLPTGGFTVNLPAIVEEYFTPEGKIKTTLPGVYWFWKDLNIPANWKDKVIRLNIESSRLRIEVFANTQLVGYDIVGDIPYSCDLTNALICGKRNRIAIRVTNPGG
ncbi:MAG: beta-glycosidase, partial [Candidatus Symbiothrix sp.]|nr:beta-glycosidase [Candidatus Symbiothrix sp.]